MKKLILNLMIAFCVILLFSQSSWAYTCQANAAGNFSAITWNNCNSTYPHSGDTIDLNGKIVVWDSGAGATLPATGTFVKIYDATNGAGELTIDVSSSFCNSGCTLSATTIVAAQEGPGDSCILSITGTTTNTLTVNVGTTPNGLIGGTNYSEGAVSNTTGPLVINGDILGSSSDANSNGLNCNSGSITVNGNIYATTASGVAANSTLGFLHINGNITGGSTPSAIGVISLSSTPLIIVGNITGGAASGLVISATSTSVPWTITGNISAGSFGANGFFNGGYSGGTITGTITGGSYDLGLSSTGYATGCGVYNWNAGWNDGDGDHVILGAGSVLVQGTYMPAWCGVSPAWISGTVKFYQGTSFGQSANTTFSTGGGGGSSAHSTAY